MAVAGYSYAKTENVAALEAVSVPEMQEPVSAEKTTTVLADRIHQISRSLEGMSAVHLYSFTSIRGQNVLLAIPSAQGFNSVWKVEHRQDGGEWRLKTNQGAEIFTSLHPGARLDVRVSRVAGNDLENTDYHLVFGSAPRMNYDLHHEDGLLRVPYGRTDPPMLATQAFKQSLLEVEFTDSKAYPLEGGVAYFELRHQDPERSISRTLVSDASGKAQELLQFGTCEGGRAAEYFVHRHNGRNTWATRYKVGKYFAANVLLEHLADKPHVYDFGHICKRTLVNWSRN
jgi:hypothetical protein